jgi:hypothetical protein
MDFMPAQPAGVLGYPQGEAMKLNRMASENWGEHLLLFTSVKNTVIKANPNVYAPFNLKVGEPSPLGLFLRSEFREKPGSLPAGRHALEYHYEHNRSIILCRAVFQDKEGRMYRDVDLKGVGYFFTDYSYNETYNKIVTSHLGDRRNENNYEGFLNKDIALYDYMMTEKFLKKGIRTCRALGIIELQEIFSIDHSKKLSYKEAVEEEIIQRDFHPVVEVRAFSTKFRIQDVCGPRPIDCELTRLMLDDAKKLVSQELGLNTIMSNLEYLEWFADTLGRNIGLMHRSGWEHHYLFHNITLDCRLVDFDGARRLKNNMARLEEFKDMDANFCIFVNSASARGEITPKEGTHLIGMLRESYNAAR